MSAVEENCWELFPKSPNEKSQRWTWRVTWKSSSQLCLRTGRLAQCIAPIQSSCRETNNTHVVLHESFLLPTYISSRSTVDDAKARQSHSVVCSRVALMQNTDIKALHWSIEIHWLILNQGIVLPLGAINGVDVGKHWATRHCITKGNFIANNTADYEVGHQGVDNFNWSTLLVQEGLHSTFSLLHSLLSAGRTFFLKSSHCMLWWYGNVTAIFQWSSLTLN